MFAVHCAEYRSDIGEESNGKVTTIMTPSLMWKKHGVYRLQKPHSISTPAKKALPALRNALPGMK